MIGQARILMNLQRFGNAITSSGILNLRHSSYARDFGPVEEGCKCTCCRPKDDGGLAITRAYVYHLVQKETVGAHLLTMHNVHHMLNLMKRMRDAILEDRLPAFIKGFFAKLYKVNTKYPEWAVKALSSVGVELMTD